MCKEVFHFIPLFDTTFAAVPQAAIKMVNYENLSAVLYGIDDLRMEDRPIPEPRDDEVQVAVHAVGICGSDVAYWKKGAIGPFVVTTPMVLGHETSGVVSKIGKNVKNLKVGDRVALEPGVPCRYCDLCKEGKYNLCQDVVFCATPPGNGTLTRYFTHASDFCYKLPDHVSFDEAACLEPLSVAVHAAERAEIEIGHNVLITGAGPIGLMSVLAAKARGATNIVCTDIDDNRLKMAKTIGATFTLNTKTLSGGNSPQQVANKIVELLSGRAPDVAVEASGAEAAVQTAVLALRPGGRFMLIGHGPVDVKVPIVEATVKEIEIHGSFRYGPNNYLTSLALVASGRVDVKPLITHHYKLEEAPEALEKARSGEGIKVIIHCEK